MDLGRVIRQQVQAAIDAARERGPTNIATATNVDSSGHRTSVYSDNDVTIIDRDGKRQVIRHRPSTEEAERAEARDPNMKEEGSD